MSTEDRTKGRIENLFSQFGRRLDDLADRVKSGEIQEDLEERMDELRDSAGQLEEDFRSWKDKNQDRWKEAEDTLEKTANTIKNGVMDIIDRIKKDASSGK